MIGRRSTCSAALACGCGTPCDLLPASTPVRGPSPRKDLHRHAHYTDASGRTWVTRSVSRCRKIPGWSAVDPLTVPFLLRPSVRRKAIATRETWWARWSGTTCAEDVGTRAYGDYCATRARAWEALVWRLNATLDTAIMNAARGVR